MKPERSRRDWQDARVSACGTHHLRDGAPLYPRRFARVLPFHAPGLAPVRDGERAWHIDADGAAAYAHSFRQTFGFYEDLAAVADDGGWFHIRVDGAPAYRARHEWCGNFQGGRCVVRERRRYRHIARDGRAPYAATYAYAGDFREGRAVVHDDDGRCAHIRDDGAPAHRRKYRDLGVYHKGHACARDDDGWMHIDDDGEPIYAGRYASLEPFYNGQALARTFDDEVVLIDQRGAVVATTSSASNASANRDRRFHALSADMVGYWKTFAIAATVELELAEQLPLAESELASRFGDAAANIRLLLMALQTLRIVECDDGVWRLSAKGDLLRARHEFSLARTAASWGAFADGGLAAWTRALRGEGGGDFFAQIAPDPAKVERSQRALAAYANNDYENLNRVLPLGDAQHLIDAGGGAGTVARMIAREWRDLRITILERAEVAKLFVRDCNEGDDDRRITALTGDLFADWGITADAVLLARVLHDWSDRCAARILANAHRALPRGGKLCIVEAAGEQPQAMLSLHLLAIGGGRDRTRKEYQDLMTESGFAPISHHRLTPSACLLVGEKTD
ncbi:MAG: methyltransferase [bacterium]